MWELSMALAQLFCDKYCMGRTFLCQVQVSSEGYDECVGGNFLT
jgi:hypothetical protein